MSSNDNHKRSPVHNPCLVERLQRPHAVWVED